MDHCHKQFIFKDGDSVLMLVAGSGHTNVTVELVKRKANLDLQNKVCTIFCLNPAFMLYYLIE